MDNFNEHLRRFRRDKRTDGELGIILRLPRETVRDIRSRFVQYPRLPVLRKIASLYEK